MNNQELENKIIDKILQSKKYKYLYQPTIKRIIKDVLNRFPEKEAEKEVKRKLHQIWGAYFKRPNFKKLLKRIEEDLKKGKDIKEIISPILKLQTSTNERISILNNFYQKIFSITGIPEKITEPACGLNALTYFWMNPSIQYIGFDVDKEEIDFLNQIFKLFKVDNKAKVKLGDILFDKIEKSDISLFLKVLPLLEHQQKGCSLDILRKCPSKYLIVSYPTKSISGKEKGMVNFYEKEFLNLIKNEDWKTEKILFETELVFVVEK